jgi:hypothetical protein
MAIVEPVKTPRLNPEKYDPKELSLFFQEVSRRLSYLTYAGDPTGNTIPRWIGDWCFDTANTEWYRSTGTTTADWEITT